MHLAEIGIYPVKSLHGAGHEAVELRPEGLAGDRRYMLVRPTGRFVTLRELPALAGLAAVNMPGGLRLERRDGAGVLEVAEPGEDAPEREVTVFRDKVPARDAGDAAAEFLKAATGADLRLVYQHDPAARPSDAAYSRAGDVVSFADGFPLLLTGRASLDALNAALAAPVEMRRFRPNLVIEGAPAWAEDGWRRIRVGEVELRVVKPCVRCIMTTRDPDTGAQPDPEEPLATLRAIHPDERGRPLFGQNLIPDGGGTICVGDKVEVLEAGAPGP